MYSSHELEPEKIPSLQEVTNSYQEVLLYNKQHTGISKGIINLLKATVESEESIETSSSVFRESLEKANNEDSMYKELTQIVHENALKSVGVSLQPGSPMKSSTGMEVGAPKLMPTIDDVQIFSLFLEQQSKEVFQEDEKHLDLIIDLIEDLRTRVINGFAPYPADPANVVVEPFRSNGELALKTFDYIENDLTRLGLDDGSIFQNLSLEDAPTTNNEEYRRHVKAKRYKENYKELGQYIHYWGQDILVQYVRVGSLEKLEQEQLMYLDGEQMNNKLIKLTAYILDMVQSDKESEKDYGKKSASHLLVGIQKTAAKFQNEPDQWFVTSKNKTLLRSLEIDILTTLKD